MVYQVYKNSKTNELVDKEEASKYVCYKLGIQIEPKGKNNEYTLEQQEFLKEFTDWYFSDGDWTEEEIEEDEDEGNVFELIAEENYYDNKLFN